VEEIIRTQKFEGASADLLNPNIIARDLGLADKQDNTTTHQAGDSLQGLMERIASNGKRIHSD
jgi:hypothetical protein